MHSETKQWEKNEIIEVETTRYEMLETKMRKRQGKSKWVKTKDGSDVRRKKRGRNGYHYLVTT